MPGSIQGSMLHPLVVAWRPILTNYIKATVLFLALEDLLIWNRGLAIAIWRDLAKAFVITPIISKVIRKSNEDTPGPGRPILLTTTKQ
jgi:hypothetical protein